MIRFIYYYLVVQKVPMPLNEWRGFAVNYEGLIPTSKNAEKDNELGLNRPSGGTEGYEVMKYATGDQFRPDHISSCLF